MNEEDDWRLNGQEKYLFGKMLYFKKYRERNTSTDHDHCEFCFSKFSDDIPGSLIEGYATEDDYHWICEECYTDFKDKFSWKLIK